MEVAADTPEKQGIMGGLGGVGQRVVTVLPAIRIARRFAFMPI